MSYLISFFDRLNITIGMKKQTKHIILLSIIAGAVSLSSCGDSTTTSTDDPVVKPPVITNKVDSSDQLITIGGEVFVVPSPIQTADLIAKSSAQFNGDILNSLENKSKYSSTFQKSLNMGIYGADLGYITVYKMTNKSTGYLKTVVGIANEIGLGNAFNEELANKISESMADEGKMLQLVSEAYKTADDYLKENKKDDIASLVIIGGWLESVHFACNVALETGEQPIIERIADQKTVLNTVLKMLKKFRDDEDYDDLAVELEDLQSLFDEITFTYEFVDPVTNEVEKSTTFKSKHKVTISTEQVQAISDKIKEIRNEIIG